MCVLCQYYYKLQAKVQCTCIPVPSCNSESGDDSTDNPDNGAKQKVTTRGRPLKKVIPDMPPCAVEAVAGIVCLFADDLTTASQAASGSKAKKTGTTGSGKPLLGHLINWPLSAAVQVVRLCLHQKH
jgi:hypothetical protein